MASTMVYDTLRLYISNDKYCVQPHESTETLVFDRVSREITLSDGSAINAGAKSQNIYGIIGVIKLISGPYLVVITDRKLIGEINGHLIWMITKAEVFPYARSSFHLNSKQQQLNKSYESMLKASLTIPGLYYSTSYDLTHTLQRLYNTSSEFSSIPLAERADQRFVWNHHLLRELQQQANLSSFTLPVVCGFIAIKPVSVKGHNFTYVLISRRSVFRAGTRYNVRGLDSEGHAANSVETEQIIEYDYSKCSYVSTRGSIPLRWDQRVDLTYKPKPLIYDIDHISLYNYHFNSQVFNYGKQVLINLVNLKGSEGRLATAFSDVVKKSGNPNIKLEVFDFHKECGHNNWGRLSNLIAKLEADQDVFGYFYVNRTGSEVHQQTGVFRLNCMDCLDRTNVVQGMLARRSLRHQLIKLGILAESDSIENQNTFNYLLRNIWADNADYISLQYAGTGALKTDFTRTGKRTKLGLLKDGWNSAVRYIKNNFNDGFRQDSIDLFLGNHVVDDLEGAVKTSPLEGERDWKFYTLPAVFLMAFVMLTFSVLLPGEGWKENIASVLFWGSACLGSLFTTYMYGKEFVDNPRLCCHKVKED